MKHNRLDTLAEKYWNGETTTAEEQEIKALLQESDCAAKHKALASYFDFTASAKTQTLDGQFDDQLLAQLNDRPAKTFTLRRMMSAAAAIIILAVAFVVMKPDTAPTTIAQNDEFIDTYQDSERAYAEVKNALMLVSSGMNSGIKHTKMLGKFDRAQNKLKNK